MTSIEIPCSLGLNLTAERFILCICVTIGFGAAHCPAGVCYRIKYPPSTVKTVPFT